MTLKGLPSSFGIVFERGEEKTAERSCFLGGREICDVKKGKKITEKEK